VLSGAPTVIEGHAFTTGVVPRASIEHVLPNTFVEYSIKTCGHRQKMLKRTQEVSGVEKIYALVGGFRLAPAPDDYLQAVMAELKKFDLDHVMPMHCSGQNFVELAAKEMPEKLVLCGTGSSFTFTA